MAAERQLRITYNMTRCYLDVARGVFVSLHHPFGEEFISQHGHIPLANATIAVVSISIIYSYLALESFFNYRLYRLWERRHSGSPEAGRFHRLLGDAPAFESLRTNRTVSELGPRIRTVCEVMGFEEPHQRVPQLWQDFNDLVKRSRHFLVHPNPASEMFQAELQRIGEQTVSGKYVAVAEGLLTFYYSQGGQAPPAWVTRNTLLGFRGVDVLTEEAQ